MYININVNDYMIYCTDILPSAINREFNTYLYSHQSEFLVDREQ